MCICYIYIYVYTYIYIYICIERVREGGRERGGEREREREIEKAVYPKVDMYGKRLNLFRQRPFLWGYAIHVETSWSAVTEDIHRPSERFLFDSLTILVYDYITCRNKSRNR